MVEPTQQQPKMQPYQMALNGCVVGCFFMMLAIVFIFSVLLVGPHVSPTPKDPEESHGH